MGRYIFRKLYFSVLALFLLAGCSHPLGNVGNLPSHKTPSMEAEWIRQGAPMEFADELWYPQDGVDILLDSEVYLMGEYKGIQFFVEKIDVQPYNRLYTKFSHNKYRIFERLIPRDKNKRTF